LFVYNKTCTEVTRGIVAGGQLPTLILAYQKSSSSQKICLEKAGRECSP